VYTPPPALSRIGAAANLAGVNRRCGSSCGPLGGASQAEVVALLFLNLGAWADCLLANSRSSEKCAASAASILSIRACILALTAIGTRLLGGSSRAQKLDQKEIAHERPHCGETEPLDVARYKRGGALLKRGSSLATQMLSRG